jgi:beta-glucanase (GH16 family)
MKETFKKVGVFFAMLVVAAGCQDDDTKFGDMSAPTNLVMPYVVVGQTAENPNGDGTGNVELSAYADDAISYKYIFPDGSTATATGGKYTKRFTTNGINDYEVTVIAYGKGGVSTTGVFMVEDVLSNFDDPITTSLLTGSGTKVWYVAAAEQGHLGVGPNSPTEVNNYWASYYMAGPFEKAASETSSCLYTNKLTFTLDGNLIKYNLENQGTFFNAAFVGVAGGSQTEDTCLPYDVSAQRSVLLEPANSVVAEQYSTGTQMTFSNNGFMGYYIGQSTYEILELTENRMVVRAVMGGNPALAWYQIFTTQDPNGAAPVEYNTLAWADEFDIDGPPNAANWTMELGNNNGWGNQEQQYYRAENAVVSGGSLKITAKKENFGGFQYTSARMQSHNKFDFTYGRVEIKAKLTSGGGTWPALWMLGSNYQTTAWPACGEIDMMEYVGNQPTTIHGTLHYPGNSGGNANSGTTTLATPTDWHVYTLVWSPESITWSIDGGPAYKTFINGAQHPYFNWDYFLIFNVAMGGTFGGNIDPAFVQSAMEVDYVRVYQ